MGKVVLQMHQESYSPSRLCKNESGETQDSALRCRWYLPTLIDRTSVEKIQLLAVHSTPHSGLPVAQPSANARPRSHVRVPLHTATFELDVLDVLVGVSNKERPGSCMSMTFSWMLS